MNMHFMQNAAAFANFEVEEEEEPRLRRKEKPGPPNNLAQVFANEGIMQDDKIVDSDLITRVNSNIFVMQR